MSFPWENSLAVLEWISLVCSSALPCGTLSTCLSDTPILGSGHVLLYPLDTVPPCRELGFDARGSTRVELSSCMYHWRTIWWLLISWCLLVYQARFSWPGCHCMSMTPFLTWSVTQKTLISIDRERCFLIVSFEISVAVMLSQCMGVAGCGWPISCKVSRIILPSLKLINNAPNSASAADATTNLWIPHMI